VGLNTLSSERYWNTVPDDTTTGDTIYWYWQAYLNLSKLTVGMTNSYYRIQNSRTGETFAEWTINVWWARCTLAPHNNKTLNLIYIPRNHWRMLWHSFPASTQRTILLLVASRWAGYTKLRHSPSANVREPLTRCVSISLYIPCTTYWQCMKPSPSYLGPTSTTL